MKELKMNLEIYLFAGELTLSCKYKSKDVEKQTKDLLSDSNS